jgi:uncharacterized membrane protein YfhO
MLTFMKFARAIAKSAQMNAKRLITNLQKIVQKLVANAPQHVKSVTKTASSKQDRGFVRCNAFSNLACIFPGHEGDNS